MKDKVEHYTWLRKEEMISLPCMANGELVESQHVQDTAEEGEMATECMQHPISLTLRTCACSSYTHVQS